MNIHKVKCDYCGKTADLKYNGEHWLIPKDWAQLWDDEKAHCVDIHICELCKPKPKKVKKSKAVK